MIMYNECPKCQHQTTRDKDNIVTCTHCKMTWAPLDLALQDLALQIQTINKAILELDDKTSEIINNLNGVIKQLQHQQTTIGKMATRILLQEDKNKPTEAKP